LLPCTTEGGYNGPPKRQTARARTAWPVEDLAEKTRKYKCSGYKTPIREIAEAVPING